VISHETHAHGLTVGELMQVLSLLDSSQKIVFSDVQFGDFDVLGPGIVGRLSEDNFQQDLRPILRLRKR